MDTHIGLHRVTDARHASDCNHGNAHSITLVFEDATGGSQLTIFPADRESQQRIAIVLMDAGKRLLDLLPKETDDE